MQEFPNTNQIAHAEGLMTREYLQKSFAQKASQEFTYFTLSCVLLECLALLDIAAHKIFGPPIGLPFLGFIALSSVGITFFALNASYGFPFRLFKKLDLKTTNDINFKNKLTKRKLEFHDIKVTKWKVIRGTIALSLFSIACEDFLYYLTINKGRNPFPVDTWQTYYTGKIGIQFINFVFQPSFLFNLPISYLISIVIVLIYFSMKYRIMQKNFTLHLRKVTKIIQ